MGGPKSPKFQPWRPLANLFSLFNPSKPPPSAPPSRALKLPPLQLSAASDTRPGWEPLVLSNEAQSRPSCSADVAAVVCPSLAYANTMFFRSAYNFQVIVDDNEPEEKLLGRFRREVMRAGVIQECKRRRFFENKQEEKKRKAREADERNRRRRPQARFATQDKPEVSKSKKGDDDDNWDVPEGVLPK
ncbi:30S ribosomal protein S21, chloroplastic-like [Salvia splendens]|uniref:30S ribosomal protein S21, chloroplastic-like n=1 Tax=Salvia splendens TaxID=180675 RepID=UPI001C2749F9|nr:30S ribosomal protein S21, chloroplastic-like [Salvia splendens]